MNRSPASRPDVRDLRGVRGDVAHLRAEVADARTDAANRSDALEAVMNARYDQAHQTMATNLEVVLAAIKGLKP